MDYRLCGDWVNIGEYRSPSLFQVSVPRGGVEGMDGEEMSLSPLGHTPSSVCLPSFLLRLKVPHPAGQCMHSRSAALFREHGHVTPVDLGMSLAP